MRVLAIDQGSSATKGALVEDGRVLARAEAPVGVRRAGARVEHDPGELLASVRQVIARLAPRGRPDVGRPDAVRPDAGRPDAGRRDAGRGDGVFPDAVALACQRSTCLLWERDGGRPVTRARSWQDTTAAARLAPLAGDADEIARRTGLRLSPHYAGGKLGLLLDETPGARERAAAGELVAGTLDAFLVHHLTGVPATEPGHAGRTLLYDLDGDAWDPWLCERFGVPPAALPALRPSAGARGAVAECGGAPLLAVAGDQQAALIGNGGPGVAVAHFGTGAFVLAGVGPAPRRHPGLLAAVTWSSAERREHQLEGSVNSAGSAVDWAARLAGVDLAAFTSATPADLELDPERLPWCLPGFVGVGPPWWLPTGGAVFAGLRLEDGPDRWLQGVLAGVALRVVDCVEALAAAGAAPVVVRASGRLARLPGLARLLADASGLPVELPAAEEAGLLGAARLAALALDGVAPPPLAGQAVARFAPRWPAERRERVRGRWKAFVAAAAALPGGPPG